MINVLSTFDGMSCGQLALERANILYALYFASEIDKHAVKVSSAKFPNMKHLGSVVDVRAADLPRIDLLLGGSPCQGFSNSGKGLNFSDPRSALFFEYVRLWEEIRAINPEAEFLLENVRMKKEWEDTISRILGIQPILINSALLSAQNRERLYWTNIAMGQRGLFGDNYCMIPQPDDKGVFLKDILQPVSEVDEKYYISEKALARILRKTYSNPQVNPDKTGALDTKNNSGTTGIAEPREYEDRQGVVHTNGELIEQDKALCIDANYFKGMDNHGQRIMVRESGAVDIAVPIDIFGNVKADNTKAATFTAGANSAGHHTQMDLLVTKSVIQVNPSTESNGVQPYQQNRIYDPNGIAPARSAELGGERQIMIQLPHGYNEGGEVAKDGKVPSVTTSSWEQNNLLVENPVVHNMHPRSGDPSKGGIGHLTRLDGETFCLDTNCSNAVEVSQADRIYNTEGKSITISARDGGLGAGTGLYEVESPIDMPDKSNALTANHANHAKKTIDDYIDKDRGQMVPVQAGRTRIRRLTPIEVCRLQTVPDEYFLYPVDYKPSAGKKKARGDDGVIEEDDTYTPGKKAGSPIMFNGQLRYQIVSDSQIYKMCGNGWTVDVIAYILSFSKYAVKS